MIVEPSPGDADGRQHAKPVRAGEVMAHCRNSVQDEQENTIPVQREQVREWADKLGIEIIKEFADHGKTGLSDREQ
jgi:hypothetical protein